MSSLTKLVSIVKKYIFISDESYMGTWSEIFKKIVIKVFNFGIILLFIWILLNMTKGVELTIGFK